MNILELLEAHAYVPSHLGHAYTVCLCLEWRASSPLAKRDEHRAHVAEVLEAHQKEREAKLRQLMRDMVDPDPCWFDHHGGCQTHGYLDLKPGELCPHDEAKQLLKDKP